MARPPGEGRTHALSEPVYVRIRADQHAVVKELESIEDRKMAAIVRRCFEAGFAALYPQYAEKRNVNLKRARG